MLMGRDLPADMKEFAELCIKLDNQIAARANDRKNEGKNKSTLVGPSSIPKVRFPTIHNEKPSPNLPSDDSMQLDAAAKQAYHKANNLCTYCGGKENWRQFSRDNDVAIHSLRTNLGNKSSLVLSCLVNASISATAMVDSGATSFFVDLEFLRQNNLNPKKKTKPEVFTVVDGRESVGGAIMSVLKSDAEI
ncbi:hypothetical protein EV44_g3193 [Erysiphe necator]|uniref:Uncharacterized protein n=1 Tax=Uncinula necator TaxID=52586 RepID=A0A0B1P0R7_UNCNE|nr:hypothetical protein EV44_g3193 [Erysiphe necator]